MKEQPLTVLAAASALDGCGDEGFSVLEQALAAPRGAEQQFILAAISFAPPQGTNSARLLLPLLIAYANDPDPECATMAIQALGTITVDWERTLPVLTNALTSLHPNVRAAATASLRILHSFPVSPYPLTNWIESPYAISSGFHIKAEDIFPTTNPPSR
jgi:hypothetical protein